MHAFSTISSLKWRSLVLAILSEHWSGLARSRPALAVSMTFVLNTSTPPMHPPDRGEKSTWLMSRVASRRPTTGAQTGVRIVRGCGAEWVVLVAGIGGGKRRRGCGRKTKREGEVWGERGCVGRERRGCGKKCKWRTSSMKPGTQISILYITNLKNVLHTHTYVYSVCTNIYNVILSYVVYKIKANMYTKMDHFFCCGGILYFQCTLQIIHNDHV